VDGTTGLFPPQADPRQRARSLLRDLQGSPPRPRRSTALTTKSRLVPGIGCLPTFACCGAAGNQGRTRSQQDGFPPFPALQSGLPKIPHHPLSKIGKERFNVHPYFPFFKVTPS
jgi:hypothetical protein